MLQPLECASTVHRAVGSEPANRVGLQLEGSQGREELPSSMRRGCSLPFVPTAHLLFLPRNAPLWPARKLREKQSH
jgi:hypothetical protein